MKQKHVTPEHKLLQNITERLGRYRKMLFELKKMDCESESHWVQMERMAAIVSELEHLLFFYGACVSEAAKHGDCIPVTSQTVMDLGGL